MFDRLIGEIYVRSMQPDGVRFAYAQNRVSQTQEEKLRNYLRQNQDTAFGKKHLFSKIRTVDQYRDAIAIHDYEDLRPWVDRAAAGEPGVLTHESPLLFERTSGTTSKNKLIPFTKTFFHEMRTAAHSWLFSTFQARPRIVGRPMYWSLSPVTQKRELTTGGIPIGVEDDSEYFGPLTRFCLKRLLVAPRSLAHIKDHDLWRKETCKRLIQCRELGFISVWSPTFLILLMEELEGSFSSYMDLLSPSIRRNIEQDLELGQPLGSALWPHLGVISCWTDGTASTFVSRLLKWFPQEALQPKGLMATEGVVSLPFDLELGRPLAITSHFLEFIDLTQAREAKTRLAHELEVGREYSPVLTTGSGLYRYHLKDRVLCTGYHANLPLVRFSGKLEQVSDLCGEKLSLSQAIEAFADLEKKFTCTFTFNMLVPIAKETRNYTAIVSVANNASVDIQAAEQELDSLLRRNFHFNYARDIGQLGPTRLHIRTDATALYTEALVQAGIRLGDIKPTALDGRSFWRDVFEL